MVNVEGWFEWGWYLVESPGWFIVQEVYRSPFVEAKRKHLGVGYTDKVRGGGGGVIIV